MHRITSSPSGRPIYRAITALAVLFLLLPLFPRAANAESGLERVRRQGKLVIGTDATYPPFESMNGSRIEGFDADIAREIGKDLGVTAELVNMEWSGVFPALETGKFDLVMSGVTITPERKKSHGFSRPYFSSGQVVVRRKGDTAIGSSKDLPGKVVAVQQETTGQTAAQKMGLPADHLHRFDTLPDALLDVRNGKSEAAIGDLPAVRDLIRKSYPELELAGDVFVHEYLGIVARQGETDLLSAINQSLGRMMVDGRYAAIYQRWIQLPLTTSDIAELDRERHLGTDVPEQAAAAVPGSSSAPTSATGGALTLRWSLMREALPLLLHGAWLTLLLTAMAITIGVPVGLLVSLCRIGNIPPLRALATAYVEVVRGTPLLMQIYVIYFVLPAIGIKLPALASGVAALSFNAAAYLAEIFRAGIESIDVGQMEAARSLGMDYPAAMRWVILPQTIRRVLPPLTNEAVALLKDSSLVSVVALAELMRVGKELATNAGSPLTIYLEVALLYLAMTLPLTHLVRRLEWKWQPVSRSSETD